MRDDHGHELLEVRLIGVPLPLRDRMVEHADEVMREIELMCSDGPHGDSGDSVAARLARLRHRLPDHYRRMMANVRRMLDDASAANQTSADVSYHLARNMVRTLVDMQLLLDLIEDECRKGDLLTVAAPADCVAYRQWVLSQNVTQIAGCPPTPWPVWSLAHSA